MKVGRATGAWTWAPGPGCRCEFLDPLSQIANEQESKKVWTEGTNNKTLTFYEHLMPSHPFSVFCFVIL